MCRSPIAEGVLKDRLARSGRTNISVVSMGIHAKDGLKAAPDSIAVCAEHGIGIEEHRSRSLQYEELVATDFIFTMEIFQTQYIRMFVPPAGEKVFLLGAWPAADGSEHEIADPIGKGIRVYRTTLVLIERHIDRILPWLLAATMEIS
jgi:protein-tyrosine-phosphatase